MKHVSAWLALGLFGCGSVTAKSPDGGSGSGTTAPMLVSSTPSANATGVSRMATIQLVFDEPLDPASVTPAAFALGCWECNPMFTTPTYDDATRTVTLVPLDPLDTGVPYELTIGTGIHDMAGNAFAGATVVFHTRPNPTVRYVQYNTSTGVPTGYSSWILDGTGAEQRSFGYGGPGADGVWLTADDVVSAHTEFVQLASGSKVLQKSYAAGADGKLGTSDDVVSAILETDNNSDGSAIAVWQFDTAGADGQWGTPDDHVSALTTITFDGRWITGEETHTGPGADGQWNTADDVITHFHRYEYDARHRMVRNAELDAGADQRADTGDDVVLDYTKLGYDAQDRYAQQVFVSAVGVDGVAGTSDDGIGPDGMWFTADDVPTAYYTHGYDDAAMQRSGSTYLSPGPDHTWMTADDVVSSRWVSNLDSRRLITAGTYYSAAGPDGVWGTSDDVISGYTTYQRDSDGLETNNTDVGSAGPDGLWHTSDDRPLRSFDFDDTH
jgi:hypothetical protein